LGRIQTAILMFLLYYIVFAFAWVVSVLLRRDLLDKRWSDTASYWRKRASKPVDIERYRHQF